MLSAITVSSPSMTSGVARWRSAQPSMPRYGRLSARTSQVSCSRPPLSSITDSAGDRVSDTNSEMTEAEAMTTAN